LGYNGWEATIGADGHGFHAQAEEWNGNQFDEYFRNGFLREVVFLLTGVGEGRIVKRVWNKEDHRLQNINERNITRSLLSLYGEIQALQNIGEDDSLLHNNVANIINRDNVLVRIERDGREFTTLNDSIITAERVTPSRYDDQYKFVNCNSFILTSFVTCVEHVMTQMINILSNDAVVLNLARKFHKQKLIEERLNQAQQVRLDNPEMHDLLFQTIGQAFERENNLADIVNRALYHLIKAKLQHAYQVYIKPLRLHDSPLRGLMNRFTPPFIVEERRLPTVNAEEMHAYIPEFMNAPLLQRILRAEYINVG
jgi:hypothetical protein